MGATKFLPQELTTRGSIPNDLLSSGERGRQVSFYQPLEARSEETDKVLNNQELLTYILRNLDIDIALRTLGNAFFPSIVTVGTTPTLIIPPNRYPRGYIFINPNQTVTGVATNVTAFPAGTIFTAGAVSNSSSISVGAFRSARAFLNITGAGGTVRVDVQSQDPVSGNWATTQSDIFSGSAGVGTYYANIGDLGIDQNFRLTVTIVGADVTGSIGVVLKEAYGATLAGATVFLGNESVNTTIGYPLMSGQKETWQLRENTSLFGIATAATVINVFELQ